MKAKEWLGVMQQAADYDHNMTRLIEKYGEMLVNEEVERRIAERLPSNAEILHKFGEDFGTLNSSTKKYKWIMVIWTINWFRSCITTRHDTAL